MHIFDIIVNENIGKDDRHLLHKILENQHLIIKQNRVIMSTQAELAAQISDFTTQLGKAKDEILAKVAALEAQIGQGGQEVTPELQAAVDGLKSAVQTLDDIVPDAPAA